MTENWLDRTINRLIDAVDEIDETITRILTDLAGRSEVARLREEEIGRLHQSFTALDKRLRSVEGHVNQMRGRQVQADLDTASTPWWRDWWAVTFMLLTVVPVSLVMSLALGLLTPDQVYQTAKAAINGALSGVGITELAASPFASACCCSF